MKCCFCGAELQHWGEDFLYCENLGCPMSPQIELPISIWQALIDGKAAQDALNDAVDEIDRALYANHYNDKAGVRKLLKDLRASITKRSEE